MRTAGLFPCLLGLSLALGALGACEKTSDLGKLEEEARYVAEESRPEVEALHARALHAVDASHSRTLEPRIQTELDDARARSQSLLAYLDRDVPAEVKNNVKTGSQEAVARTIDLMRQRVERDKVEINANLTSVETYMWNHPATAPVPSAAPTPEKASPQP